MRTISYRENYFEAKDGIRLYRRSWGTGDKGVVLLIHGFGEHVGRYNFVVKALNNRGYRVEGLDCRGHGRSDGPRGHIDDFNQYLEDLDTFLHQVQSEYPVDIPLFLLGHSQGGHIALRYAIEYPHAPLSGVITSSPFLGLALKVNPVQLVAARLMSRVWPTFSQATPLDEGELTHDAEVVEQTRRDPMYIRVASARWYRKTIKAQENTMRRAASFRFPFLMQQAGEDRVVDKHTALQFFERISSPDRRRIEYPGYFHEIYNETPDRRSPVFEDLGAWLEDHS